VGFCHTLEGFCPRGFCPVGFCPDTLPWLVYLVTVCHRLISVPGKFSRLLHALPTPAYPLPPVERLSRRRRQRHKLSIGWLPLPAVDYDVEHLSIPLIQYRRACGPTTRGVGFVLTRRSHRISPIAFSRAMMTFRRASRVTTSVVSSSSAADVFRSCRWKAARPEICVVLLSLLISLLTSSEVKAVFDPTVTLRCATPRRFPAPDWLSVA